MLLRDVLNIAVVDDHEMVRKAFVTMLASWPHGKVVLTAGNGLDYENRCANGPRIDLAIVDLMMPVRDGYETMVRMARFQPDTIPAALTFEPTDTATRKAMRAGARCVWGKDVEEADLLRDLDLLRTTGLCVTPIMRQQLGADGRLLPDETPESIARRFTDKEREFICAFCSVPHHSMAEVAKVMGISVNTARDYCKRVYDILGVDNAVEFYRVAVMWKLHEWTPPHKRRPGR